MKWKKIREPYRVEIIRDVDLYDQGGKVYVSASSRNPVKGVVTHYAYKKIGRNDVRFLSFHPDVSPISSHSISENWVRRI